MPKVHMVNDRDLTRDDDGKTKEVELITSVEVRRSPDRPVLYLDVGVFWQGEADGRTIPLALTPPAAHQLAQLLQTAVDQHLQSTPGEPFDVSQFVA